MSNLSSVLRNAESIQSEQEQQKVQEKRYLPDVRPNDYKTPKKAFDDISPEYRDQILECRDKILAMYADPKKLGFVKHLVYSYGNRARVYKVMDFDSEPNKVRKCSITGILLMDVSTAVGMINEFTELTLSSLPFGLMTEKTSDEDRKNVTERYEKAKLAVKEKQKGRVLCVSSADTDTCISEVAYEALILFIQERLLNNDMIVSKILAKLRNW